MISRRSEKRENTGKEESSLQRLDRNRDGFIDANERSTSGVDAVVINGLVTVADMNGDGLLSRDEFDRATDQDRVRTQVRIV